jgi:hypothetical protein
VISAVLNCSGTFSLTYLTDIYPLLKLTSNSTNCGISPILNVTLLNSTAHDDYKPYQNFSYATIWSWAPGEPRNFTASSSSNSGSVFRCATLNIDLGGRWAVADCSQENFAACRAQNQPYNWTITTYSVLYSFAAQACQDPYSFTAPRTALENSYLTQAIRSSHRDYDGNGIWVDVCVFLEAPFPNSNVSRVVKPLYTCCQSRRLYIGSNLRFLPY